MRGVDHRFYLNFLKNECLCLLFVSNDINYMNGNCFFLVCFFIMTHDNFVSSRSRITALP